MTSLTTRERQVAMLVGQALTNKEIGLKLGMSEGTVKVHMKAILHKLEMKNRTALALLVTRAA